MIEVNNLYRWMLTHVPAAKTMSVELRMSPHVAELVRRALDDDYRDDPQVDELARGIEEFLDKLSEIQP